MNAEQVNGLCGRELDAAVAEHVLGWRWYWWIGKTCRALLPGGAYDPERHPFWPIEPCEDMAVPVAADRSYNYLPRFSADIAAAWEVFQHCRKWPFSQRTRFFRELGRLLQCRPELKAGERVAWPDAMMYLDAEKICRAALLAVMPPA